MRPVSHTSLADTQPIQRVPSKPAAAPETDANGSSIEIGLAPLISQLPEQLFTETGYGQLSSLKLALPVGLVLPQLSSGRISVKLEDLLSLFPAAVLRNPLPPVAEQQSIVLPLQEVIASIPPELLTTTHESEIRADDPELEKLPKLIDDSLMEAAPVATTPAEIKKTPAPVSSAIVVPPRPKTNNAPEYVMVSLRSMVAVMPDAVFCCPRTQLSAKVNLDTPVLLPTDPIIPQLRTGSVKLPLSIIIAMVPHQVLAHPMPALDGQMIPVPLAEIIPQLPQTVFTEYLRELTQEPELSEMDIPDPFQDKSVTPEVSAPVAEPFAIEPVVDVPALEDETFSVFTERTPVESTEPVEVFAETPVEPESPALLPETVVEPVVAEVPVQPVIEAVELQTPAPEPTISEPVAAEAPASTTETIAEHKTLLVNLNRCTVEDLTVIDGIGRALAQRIIDFRNARGQFHTVDELRQVPGIGRKTFRALAGVQPRALNRLLGAPHEGELTLQEVVRLTSKLPGIEGCMLASSDGLFLTGELPAHLDQSTISVFAPQLFKKVGRYARELKVGSIRRFTIFTDTQPISIFRAGDVYLIVIHDAFRFSKALLRRCERISQEIARLSSQRVTV